MQREPVTVQQIEEWKKIFEKYKTLLVPNRKTGQEIVDYIIAKYNVDKFEDDEANKVVYYNVMENELLKSKLKGDEKPIPVTFYLKSENKEVFLGVDLVSGFYCVEDDEDLWDEICAFQGLDEDDLSNYYRVAEYINCLNKFGILEDVLNKQPKV